jgi:hypothetical protein
MRIERLTFLNFRCFENYSLNLKKGTNLLFGVNSSGKTTILRGMKIAMSSFFSGFSDANTRFKGIADDDFMSEIECDIESLERPVSIEYDFAEFQGLKLLRTGKKNRTSVSGIKNLRDAAKNLYLQLAKEDDGSVELPLFAAFSTEDIHSSRKLDKKNFAKYYQPRSFGYYEYQGERFKVWGPSKNVNADLRWEKGHNQNFGVDFSMFNHRLSGSLNYFLRYQTDLLGEYDVPVPPNLFNKIYANVGTMRNQGIEFDITVNAIRKENFNWDLTVVGATSDNKFLSFSNDLYQGQSYYSTCTMDNPNNPGSLQRIEEGQRVGNYFTYRYAGVDNSGDWLIFDKNNNVIPVSQGTEEDKTVTGNGLPKFTGSITSSFKLYDFDFSFSLRGAAGFQIFNVHDFYYGLQSMNTNLLVSAYSRNAHITSGKNVISDYFLEPGDYLKLDNVSVGYSLKLNKKFIDKVRVFFNANNLYTLTKFTGIDPSVYEVNGLTPGTFGGSAAYYPSAFQFVFGLQVGF